VNDRRSIYPASVLRSVLLPCGRSLPLLFDANAGFLLLDPHFGLRLLHPDVRLRLLNIDHRIWLLHDYFWRCLSNRNLRSGLVNLNLRAVLPVGSALCRPVGLLMLFLSLPDGGLIISSLLFTSGKGQHGDRDCGD